MCSDVCKGVCKAQLAPSRGYPKQRVIKETGFLSASSNADVGKEETAEFCPAVAAC